MLDCEEGERLFQQDFVCIAVTPESYGEANGSAVGHYRLLKAIARENENERLK